MDFAKPYVDIGLNTNNLQAMRAFWEQDAGAAFDHILPIRRGVKQYRYDIGGTVLKVNNHYEPLPQRPPSGYSELLIARDGIAAERRMRDPDGNAVRLVPKGAYGITQVGIKLQVRSIAAHRAFFTDALELEEAAPDTFRAGETLLLLEESANATGDASMEGMGWRYITFQVMKVDQAHARVLSRGGREAMAPTTLGETARISMIRDPDGNWIELSQRASLVGPLTGA